MWKSKAMAAAGLLALGLSAGAEEQSFVFASIDVPDAISTSVLGINARGEVVGAYRDPSNRQHGYVWSGEAFQTIDFPGAIVTDARGISPDGDIVGAYRNPGEPPVNAHGYRLTRGGVFVPVDYPGHTNTIAHRIGPDGTIVGCYHDQDVMGSMHSMVIRGGEWSELEVAASMHTGATPDGSAIVGFYTDMDTGKGRAYLVKDGSFQPFDVPGAVFTAGWDINPAGEVVGGYQDSNGRFHGYVVDGEWNFTSIDFPGATHTRAWGINARGDVVGRYEDTSNRTHGFLATRTGAHNP
jgi:uncharacterized membrane protein